MIWHDSTLMLDLRKKHNTVDTEKDREHGKLNRRDAEDAEKIGRRRGTEPGDARLPAGRLAGAAVRRLFHVAPVVAAFGFGDHRDSQFVNAFHHFFYKLR